MGCDLILVAILQPNDTKLAWDFGYSAIDAIESLDQCSGPLSDMADDLDEYKIELRGKLDLLREAETYRDFRTLEVVNGTLWIAGGSSWGDSPGEIFDAIGDQEPFVLAEIGFRAANGEHLI
jgi:hypothetical protein